METLNEKWSKAVANYMERVPEGTYSTAQLVTMMGAFKAAVEEVCAEPAKPALPAKWEERWWNVYLRFFMDGKAMSIAATEADDVVAFARKHLEGEE